MELKERVLFEDDWYIAFDKPIGVDVQREVPKLQLGLIHRIDTPVSGVLLCSKTTAALAATQNLFITREIEKIYWAVVGKELPSPQGSLQHYLEHDQKTNKTHVVKIASNRSQEASLNYRFLAKSDRYFLYEVGLLTGRTHQIRAQFSAAGSPIKGDLKYGFARSNRGGGILLLARSLKFVHPFLKSEVVVVAEPPKNDPVWAALTTSLQNDLATS